MPLYDLSVYKTYKKHIFVLSCSCCVYKTNIGIIHMHTHLCTCMYVCRIQVVKQVAPEVSPHLHLTHRQQPQEKIIVRTESGLRQSKSRFELIDDNRSGWLRQYFPCLLPSRRRPFPGDMWWCVYEFYTTSMNLAMDAEALQRMGRGLTNWEWWIQRMKPQKMNEGCKGSIRITMDEWGIMDGWGLECVKDVYYECIIRVTTERMEKGRTTDSFGSMAAFSGPTSNANKKNAVLLASFRASSALSLSLPSPFLLSALICI